MTTQNFLAKNLRLRQNGLNTHNRYALKTHVKPHINCINFCR